MFKPPCVRQRSSQTGYVLIFVLGVVFVLSVMVLGLSSGSRIGAAEVLARQRSLQSEYQLSGALQRVLWGLENGQIAQDIRPQPSIKTAADWAQLMGQPFSVAIDGQLYRVLIEDAAALLDPNLLTRDMWERLGMALGLSPAAALQLAEHVEQAKAAHRVVSSEPLFRNLNDLTDLPGLSKSLVYGVAAPNQPALVDLLAFGNSALALDINNSPVALYRIVHNVNDAKARTLLTWRSQRRLTAEDERLLLGASDLAAPGASAPSAAQQAVKLLKISLSFEDAAVSSQRLQAFVKPTFPAATVRSTHLFYRT